MDYALVTGASSGIGFELSRLFAKDKINLVIVARNKEKLEELKKDLEQNFQINAVVIQKDLSGINSAEEVFNEIESLNITIKYLINNAGAGDYGNFASADIKRQEEIINLNILSLVKLTRLFLPKLSQIEKSRILNIASVAGFLPGPMMSVYFATKAFVISFSQSISYELSGKNPTVTCFCPSATKTNFENAANAQRAVLFQSAAANVESVAKTGYKAMMKGQDIVIYGFTNRIFLFLADLLPWRVQAFFSSMITKEI